MILGKDEYERAGLTNDSLLATLAFSDNDDQSSRPCAVCAEFRIRSVPDLDKFDDGCLISFLVSQHKIFQEYKDTYPGFPNMSKRATQGCNFCRFLVSTLLSENRKLDHHLQHKEEVVQISLTASVSEHMHDRSPLSMYRTQKPHTIQVQVRGGEVDFLSYAVAFHMTSGAISTGTHETVKLTIEI